MEMGPEAYTFFEQTVKEYLGEEIRSDEQAARDLWSALANITWYHLEKRYEVGYTFRAAGHLIAEIRGEGSYIDWYLCADAAIVSDKIARAMKKAGWIYDDVGEICDVPGCIEKAQFYTREGRITCPGHEPERKRS